MTISMYQASAPVFDKMLENLSAILGKAATWAETRKIDPVVLMNARLAPDMFALARQVQIACDSAKGAVARIGSEGRDVKFQAGPREFEFKGLAYLTGFALPNFYFHHAMTYAILRHNGLDLSKKDYIG